MANPFLMSDLEIGDTHVSSSNGSFNPFLSGGADFAASEIENPFMSTFTTTNTNTNPFAFSSEDAPPSSSPFFDAPQTQSTTTTQPPVQSYENIFSTPVNGHATTEMTNDFFGGFTNTPEPQPTHAVPPYPSARSSIDHTPSLMDNVNLFGSDPLDMPMSRDGSGASTPKGAPPRRPPPPGGPSHGPPPPRPGPPPSKETQDLILSVTGAMEATSSHMLDRLQATRTPSPTLIRDLDSPSPTPDMFGDLLGVDDIHKGQPKHVVEEMNFLGDMDDDVMPTITPMQPNNMIPIAPMPHSVPPVVPVAPSAQVPPVPPAAAVHPPRPLPPRPPERPERPKAPPPVSLVQDNIMQLNTMDQPPVAVTAAAEVNFPDKPAEVNGIFGLQPEETRSARPSEPELDFSEVNIPTTDSTVNSAFVATELETTVPPAFPSVFETQVTTIISEPDQVFSLEEQAIVNNPTSDTGFYNSAYEDTRQETPYPSSPFDQQNGAFDDASFASGFDSEMNITVKEVSPAATDSSFDNSVFGAPSNHDNNGFFNNTVSSSYQHQAADLFAPMESAPNTTPVAPSQPLNIFGDPGMKAVDDFDAFSAKFESAGFDDNRNAAPSSGAFGDPFSSSPFGADQIGGEFLA